MNRRAFLSSGISTIALSRLMKTIGAQAIEGQAARLLGGAANLSDREASAGYLVALTQPGQGVKFTGLPAASKLAIRYASVTVGTISVAVNDQPARKVNVHSSGALTNSFLNAIIDLAIPANATLTISLATNDVAVNIDRIIVGGDLGLPPDIWNLPPLPVAAGPYPADWKAIEPALHRAGVVARRQVRRMGALGSAVHARAGRLVCARHVSGGQPAISIPPQTFRPSVGIRLQGHLPQLGD